MLLLSQQLSDFVKTADQNNLLNEWSERFYPRVQKIRGELDEMGLLSQTLNQTRFLNLDSTVVQTIADELKKMAEKIKD
jgi:hypothetical protein